MMACTRPILAGALALVLAQPLAAQEADSAAEATADTVVASVGETDITLGEVIVLVSQLPDQYQQLPDEQLFNAALDQLISQTAIARTVEDELTKESKLALSNQRRAFLAGEALDRIAGERVTEEDIQAAYDAQYADQGGSTEYNAQHILLETQDEAQAVRRELSDGADFAELAREKSTGPSSSSGGDLGWFAADAMIAPFSEAIASLSPGEVSDPVETQFGWHVIRLNETREQSPPALSDVRSEISQQLRNEEVQAVIDEITAEADIERAEEAVDPALIRQNELLSE